MERTELDSEQKVLVETANMCCKQLLNLINGKKLVNFKVIQRFVDVLDLTKIEQNKMVLEEADFDVRKLVGDTLEMLQVLASKKDLMLVEEIDDNIPKIIRGDACRLGILFQVIIH